VVGYGGDMERTKPLTAAEQALLDQGWSELGQSIAETVVVGGKSLKWAWDLIGPLGIYKHWMLKQWIQRYRDEHPEPENPDVTKRPKSRRRKTPPAMQSKFTKREQIHEALRLLNDQTGR
jgi:hypothetical protein